MVETKKIQAKMVENGFTFVKLAEATGISKTALHRKVHNDTDFTLSEACSVAKALNLTKEEFLRLFNLNYSKNNRFDF